MPILINWRNFYHDTDIDEDYDPMAGYEPAGLSHQSGKAMAFLLKFSRIYLKLLTTNFSFEICYHLNLLVTLTKLNLIK